MIITFKRIDLSLNDAQTTIIVTTTIFIKYYYTR